MTIPDLAAISDIRRAAALLHPLRLRLVSLAAEPASATELAALVGLSRQNVHYHVRQLAKAGFLRRAGQVRKRNLTEQRYVATARAYVLAPELLGALAPGQSPAGFSASRLVAMAGRAQADVTRAFQQADALGLRLATASMTADLSFERPGERRAFADALQAAIADVIGRFSRPAGESRGRRFRLIAAWYPLPTEEPRSSAP